MPRGIPNKMKAKKEKKNKVEVPTELPPVSAYEQGANAVDSAQNMRIAEAVGTASKPDPIRPPTAYTRKILCKRLQELEAQDTLYKDQIAFNRHKLDEVRSEIYRVEHELFRFSNQGYDNY